MSWSFSRRELLWLAMSWLQGLWWKVALFLFFYFSSSFNLWSWLWREALSQEPQSWILLLGDSGLISLLFCSALSFFPTLLLKRGGWPWVWVPLALYSGVLSLPNAWVAVLVESLALSLVRIRRTQNDVLRSARWARALIALFVFVMALLSVGWLREWIRFFDSSFVQNPLNRIFWYGLGLGMYAALETVLSSLFFHFFYIRTKVRIQNLSPDEFK